MSPPLRRTFCACGAERRNVIRRSARTSGDTTGGVWGPPRPPGAGAAWAGGAGGGGCCCADATRTETSANAVTENIDECRLLMSCSRGQTVNGTVRA